MGTRIIGLMGSGEFEPWAEAVDRALLKTARRGDGLVAVLPTASWRDGEEVFEGWARKGLDHYKRLGIPARAVRLRTRDDAEAPESADILKSASVVFFSGGNPAYLAETLAGTRFWHELLTAMHEGVAYGGCSAGAACLGILAPDSDREEMDAEIWKPGLGFFPSAVVMPHWDMLDSYAPGLQTFVTESVDPAHVLSTIDEETAMLGDGSRWSVVGRGSVRRRVGGAWDAYSSGAGFDLALL